MKFAYYIDLKEGYKVASPLFTEEEKEITFTIEARNRATADRMVKALLKPYNVEHWDGIGTD